MKGGRPVKVADLGAGLVPLRDFALREWYFCKQLWYYHRERQKPCSLTQLSELALPQLDLIDPDLRDLCACLHQAGLLTTPSCSGHFFAAERFYATWEMLKADEVHIRDKGLVLENSARQGELIRFQNPDYHLPWETREHFCAEVKAYQNLGYLGVVVPKNRERLIERWRKEALTLAEGRVTHDAELSEVFGLDTFSIRVEPTSTESRTSTWREITRYFSDRLKGGE